MKSVQAVILKTEKRRAGPSLYERQVLNDTGIHPRMRAQNEGKSPYDARSARHADTVLSAPTNNRNFPSIVQHSY